MSNLVTLTSLFSGVPIMKCCRVDDTSSERAVTERIPILTECVSVSIALTARWNEGVHKVSSNDCAVGATPQSPDGDPV